jgi:hypothetical protein
MSLDPQSLQVGQTVALHEMNYGVQIRSPQEGETGLTVLAVTSEHLVLDDAAGGTLSIPVHLIHKPAAIEVSTEVRNSEAA